MTLDIVEALLSFPEMVTGIMKSGISLKDA